MLISVTSSSPPHAHPLLLLVLFPNPPPRRAFRVLLYFPSLLNSYTSFPISSCSFSPPLIFLSSCRYLSPLVFFYFSNVFPLSSYHSFNPSTPPPLSSLSPPSSSASSLSPPSGVNGRGGICRLLSFLVKRLRSTEQHQHNYYQSDFIRIHQLRAFLRPAVIVQFISSLN